MPSRRSTCALLALLLAACGTDHGVAGTYVLDQEAARAAAKAWLLQNPIPPGMTAEELEKRIEEGLDAGPEQSVELVLKPDGTFVQSATMGSESNASSGTWALEGTRLTLVTTRENGQPVSEPVEVVAKHADGTITLSEKIEYPVVLRRR